jgi:Ras-related protein Rab-11A
MEKKGEKYIPAYKTILIGDSGVGKTSILKRFLYNTFDDYTMTTIGMNSSIYDMTLKDGTQIKIKIMDTAGEEKYKSLGKRYFTNADAVLFVFALDNMESLEHITSWLKVFEDSSNTRIDVPKYLIGNKSDLIPEIHQEQIDKFLKENNTFKYKATSAKEGNKDITEVFQELGEILYKENKKYENVRGVQLKLNSKEKKNCALADCIM